MRTRAATQGEKTMICNRTRCLHRVPGVALLHLGRRLLLQESRTTDCLLLQRICKEASCFCSGSATGRLPLQAICKRALLLQRICKLACFGNESTNPDDQRCEFGDGSRRKAFEIEFARFGRQHEGI